MSVGALDPAPSTFRSSLRYTHADDVEAGKAGADVSGAGPLDHVEGVDAAQRREESGACQRFARYVEDAAKLSVWHVGEVGQRLHSWTGLAFVERPVRGRHRRVDLR